MVVSTFKCTAIDKMTIIWTCLGAYNAAGLVFLITKKWIILTEGSGNNITKN